MNLNTTSANNKIAFFSTQPYDKTFFNKYNADFGFELDFYETQLNPQTVILIEKAEIVCVFVNDIVNEAVIKQLAQHPLTDIGIEKFLKDWEKVPK